MMPRRHFMGDRTYRGVTYTLQLEAVEDCVFKAHARLLPSGPEVSVWPVAVTLTLPRALKAAAACWSVAIAC